MDELNSFVGKAMTELDATNFADLLEDLGSNSKRIIRRRRRSCQRDERTSL